MASERDFLVVSEVFLGNFNSPEKDTVVLKFLFEKEVIVFQVSNPLEISCSIMTVSVERSLFRA
jgi:hypothetical protein